MSEPLSVPNRQDVRPDDTWDLSPLFADDASWEKALKKMEARIPEFEAFRGKLGSSAQVLLECCELESSFNRDAEKIGSYAFLKASENLADSAYQGMIARYTYVATRAEEAGSYIASEIRAIPKSRMESFLADPVLSEYRFVLEKLLRHRPHILSEKEERLLAMQGEVAGSAGRIFGQLNDADMKFGFIRDEKGNQMPLTQASFRSLLESPSRIVRKKAFNQFYAQYEAHANTLAASLSASVLQDVYHARARKYPSAREASLFHDHVPVSVYDNLITAVHDKIGVVHHYLEVRRKALRVSSLHMYDTYVPIVHPRDVNIPYDEAVSTICQALAPLGAKYCDTLEKGLCGRWVDRYENQGKRSGAFSAGGYTGPPYILMNYRSDTIDSMFTLAHEAGHSMHTWHSAKAQPFQYYDYPIFLAEVASTFNEILLTRHLLQQASDRAERAFLVNREIDEIRGTIIRQTMFAEFEKIIHDLAEAGEPLTLEVFREEYRKLLELYFGPDFVIDDALSLEGLRIPHFYHAFYVYKYATGLSAAIALADKLINGGAPARKAYEGFLKAGCSKYPLDTLRQAGVDMEQPEPVGAAMQRLCDLVDELEDLL